CADSVCRADRQQRVAVRRRPYNRLSGNIRARPGPVLDDELLAEPIRQPLSHEASDDVLIGAGGCADDHAHRLRRISLSPCLACGGREDGSARCQMEELSSVKKFHDMRLGALVMKFLESRSYWITSSAVASSVSGIVRPRAFAVLRLMTRSIFVICCTGRSAGLSPFRTRPV